MSEQCCEASANRCPCQSSNAVCRRVMPHKPSITSLCMRTVLYSNYDGTGSGFSSCTATDRGSSLCDRLIVHSSAPPRQRSGNYGCHRPCSGGNGTGRGRSPPRPLLAVPNVTAHPSTASVPITVLICSGVYLDFLTRGNLRSLRGGRVRGEDLNLRAILMYIVSMINQSIKKICIAPCA